MAVEIEWEKMTAPELRTLAARPDALAVLPIGALEQHGPHLPVNTDTVSASAISLLAARLVAEEVPIAVLPGLWLGMSENMNPFGGTISVDYATLHGMLRGIIRSLKAAGFSRLLIINGHGGNMNPLAVAIRELAVEYAMPVGAATPWLLAADELEAVFETARGVKHACEGEASLMLAIAPDTVRADMFDEAVRLSQPLDNKMPRGFSRPFSFAEIAPGSGTQGDPRTATREKGQRFLEIQADAVARLIRDPGLWTMPDAVWNAGRGQQSDCDRVD